MYCVNGNPPYFRTLQEARAYALASSDLWLGEVREGGFYAVLVDIYDDTKVLAGSVVYPPDAPMRKVGDREVVDTEQGIFYLKAGTTTLQFVDPRDGSILTSYGTFDFNMSNNRYRIPFRQGDLPFMTIEDARRYQYDSYQDPDSIRNFGSPILNRRGEVVGLTFKTNDGRILYGKGKKWYELRPDGRLGRAVKGNFTVHYDEPRHYGTSFTAPFLVNRAEPTDGD